MVQVDQSAQNAPLWTVGVPKQTQVPDPSGRYVAGWEVPVILVDKSTFTVQIPATEFTPENVMSVIEDHINRLTAVRALTGPTY